MSVPPGSISLGWPIHSPRWCNTISNTDIHTSHSSGNINVGGVQDFLLWHACTVHVTQCSINPVLLCSLSLSLSLMCMCTPIHPPLHTPIPLLLAAKLKREVEGMEMCVCVCVCVWGCGGVCVCVCVCMWTEGNKFPTKESTGTVLIYCMRYTGMHCSEYTVSFWTVWRLKVKKVFTKLTFNKLNNHYS